ncbi:uncharacterized protein LOC134540081 [Bacillus rossius redtenbacheri]|uniref:uncharacterized protein LOC134540081 n=1 Tax=Bacillus rossius redtenbacheri TaxID=93214 RepID=UPI002FDD1143
MPFITATETGIVKKNSRCHHVGCVPRASRQQKQHTSCRVRPHQEPAASPQSWLLSRRGGKEGGPRRYKYPSGRRRRRRESMDADGPCNATGGACGDGLNATGRVARGALPSRLHEFQIVKAAVLAVVTLVILVSVSKMVFQLFVRYAVRSGDK